MLIWEKVFLVFIFKSGIYNLENYLYLTSIFFFHFRFSFEKYLFLMNPKLNEIILFEKIWDRYKIPSNQVHRRDIFICIAVFIFIHNFRYLSHCNAALYLTPVVRFAFFVLVILLHVKVYKHNEAQKFVAECIKNVGMDHRKLQNLFFVKKDTDGIVTIDNTWILLRIHINEKKLK